MPVHILSPEQNVFARHPLARTHIAAMNLHTKKELRMEILTTHAQHLDQLLCLLTCHSPFWLFLLTETVSESQSLDVLAAGTHDCCKSLQLCEAVFEVSAGIAILSILSLRAWKLENPVSTPSRDELCSHLPAHKLHLDEVLVRCIWSGWLDVLGTRFILCLALEVQ